MNEPYWAMRFGETPTPILDEWREECWTAGLRAPALLLGLELELLLLEALPPELTPGVLLPLLRFDRVPPPGTWIGAGNPPMGF